MNQIVATIVPIFTVIGLGWWAHRRGFLPVEFLAPANRLVFYLAIPAMIFRAIAKADFKTQTDVRVAGVALAAVLGIYVLSWLFARRMAYPPSRCATFVQSAFHGNLGYIGLAVAYYYLGDSGLAQASILAGFLMILQNLLAVAVLQVAAERAAHRLLIREVLRRIVGNPVILSAFGGILFSLTGLHLPQVVGRSLDILSGLALPTALLIIGGSLSFSLMRVHLSATLLAAVFKLVLLPLVGLTLYRLWAVAPGAYMPALILLASPTATIAYVMAREIDGDPDLAAAAISASTVGSALTFSLWLHLAR